MLLLDTLILKHSNLIKITVNLQLYNIAARREISYLK